MSFLSFFKKKRLASKGLSCGKTRLSAREGELADLLERSSWIRSGIVLGTVGLLCLLTLGSQTLTPLKDLLYSLLILAVVIVHPLVARGGALASNSRLALFLAAILFQLGISSLLLGEMGEGGSTTDTSASSLPTRSPRSPSPSCLGPRTVSGPLLRRVSGGRSCGVRAMPDLSSLPSPVE